MIEFGDSKGRLTVSTKPYPQRLSHQSGTYKGWSKAPGTEVCLVWPQWEKIQLILERLEAPGNGEA